MVFCCWTTGLVLSLEESCQPHLCLEGLVFYAGLQVLLLFQSLQVVMYSQQLECGPMPNMMAALPNIGGALCSTTQSLADAHS